ncbi:Imm6 family immunity protein [Bacillus paralicheniformis]|uniref:Imm6 family immunity protein n=1 Tax=Bacillus paralicheniformis TaxID=1648923 RepID=UPI003A87A7A5
MFQEWEELNDDLKSAYYLGLCEAIVPTLKQSNDFNYIKEALDACWKWLEHKNIEADDLYTYLENLDDTGILTLMQLESNEDALDAWICIADAISYTIYKAYKYQKDEYLPETIESIDSYELFEEFHSHFSLLSKNPGQKEKAFLKFLKKEGSEKVSRESIQDFLLNSAE